MEIETKIVEGGTNVFIAHKESGQDMVVFVPSSGLSLESFLNVLNAIKSKM